MSKPDSLYHQMGGEIPLRKLVDDFYDVMDASPFTAGIRKMHPENLQSSRDKLFEFLSGWTGGPNLFVEKHGHPRLRARHISFKIGTSERDQWLYCFHQALEKAALPDHLAEFFRNAVINLADHMRNQSEAEE